MQILRRTCECTNLPDIFKLSACPKFERRTERVASGADWAHLHRCRRCGQEWRIDAWDKYWPRFVIRAPDSAVWESFDATPLRKDFLLRSRGGLTEEECEWQSCSGKRVRGVAFCIDHLYEAGARE